MKRGFVKKTCSFYVSGYHLVTMLLPYIKQKIDEGSTFKTMLEENVEENMVKLVENLSLEMNYKENILGINWKSFQVYKYPKIEEELQDEKMTNLIIAGKYEYVEMMNKNVEKWLERNGIENSIIINNCYDVIRTNEDIDKILEKHDMVLNTMGEQDTQSILNKNKIVNK